MKIGKCVATHRCDNISILFVAVDSLADSPRGYTKTDINEPSTRPAPVVGVSPQPQPTGKPSIDA